MGTGENASLTSKTPMSSTVRPLFLSAFLVAGIGAVSMITGSSAARTAVCTRASGVRPSWLAFSLVIMSRAADPSLICELLPAWMTPPVLNAGLSLAIDSSEPPRRTPSSASIAELADAAPDHVVHHLGVHPGALGESIEHVR